MSRCGKNWQRYRMPKRRFNAAEHLVHTTKKESMHCFDFDLRFPKMLSYLRQSRHPACIWGQCILLQNTAGSVGKDRTERAGKPRLAYENHAMPVFYRDVMYREGAEGKDEAYLKLYDGHDWKWFCVASGAYRYGISEQNTGQGKRHLLQLWKRDTGSIFCVFPIQKK